MLKNYCISSVKSLKELPFLDVAQFTLNSRVYPAKRRTVDTLREMAPYHTAKVIVHYDFIYIISRFSMFRSSLQTAILEECHQIMKYANEDHTILGIIMHTDWSLKKTISANNLSEIADSYGGSIWDPTSIEVNFSEHSSNWLEFNILEFYRKFTILYPNFTTRCKIYLENTTKVASDNYQGTLQSIVDILDNHPELDSLFGICLDTEHNYATTGNFDNEIYSLIFSNHSLIVHLNTVPSEVKPLSKKDRHSNTTLSECSLYPIEHYQTLIELLNSHNIPWVREVKEDTMRREIKQLSKL